MVHVLIHNVPGQSFVTHPYAFVMQPHDVCDTLIHSIRDTIICVCDVLIYNDEDTLIHIIRDTIICVRDAIICVRDALIYNDGDTLIHNVQT